MAQNSQRFREALSTGILVSDGAMGTMLQQKGLVAGECAEEWNISHRARFNVYAFNQGMNLNQKLKIPVYWLDFAR